MGCMRCHGERKMYQVGNNAYSCVNSGGILVDCPMCLGKGKTKTLEQAMKDNLGDARRSELAQALEEVVDLSYEKKLIKDFRIGATLDSFLKEEGMLETVEGTVVQNLSKKRGRPKKEIAEL